MNRCLRVNCGVRTISPKKSSRSAIAAIEFAVMLPLMLMLVLGALESARAVMVTHALQQASQAACRVYSVGGTTMEQVTAIVEASLANTGIENYNIQFDPKKKEDVDKTLMEVTVTITVPYTEVAWLPPTYFAGATLEGRSVLPADLEVSDGGDSDGYHFTDDDYNGDGIVRD